MASPTPDRDQPRPQNPDKDENPFIKFKRFADTQVSSVLQGIIGLPSAFSKNGMEPNDHWTAMDEDLKRRGRILERIETHKAAKDLEGKESRVATNELKANLKPSNLPASTGIALVDGNIPDAEVDLFSLTTKSMFAHLNRTPLDNREWTRNTPTGIDLWIALKPFIPIDRINTDQKTYNTLETMQAMLYDSFNRTNGLSPPDHGDPEKTLLPYLLFSGYSPLALTALPPLRPKIFALSHQDNFMYCRAFEDLIRITRGQEPQQQLWSSQSGVVNPPKINMETYGYVNWNTRNKSPDSAEVAVSNAVKGMTWLSGLYSNGLLTEIYKGPFMEFSTFQLQSAGATSDDSTSHTQEGQNTGFQPIAGLYQMFREHDQETAGEVSLQRSNSNKVISSFESKDSHGSEDPRTENEMYERFLVSASPQSSPPNPLSIAESIIAESLHFALNQLEKIVKKDTPIKSPDQPPTSSSVTQTSEAAHHSSYPKKIHATGEEKFATSDCDHTRILAEQNKIKHLRNQLKAEEPQNSYHGRVADDPHNDRIVSTTTWTEQTTAEDGTVYTTVDVEKQYADGRVTRSSRTHTDEPADRNRPWMYNDSDKVEQDLRDPKEREHGGSTNADYQNGRKKGWFWSH